MPMALGTWDVGGRASASCLRMPMWKYALVAWVHGCLNACVVLGRGACMGVVHGRGACACIDVCIGACLLGCVCGSMAKLSWAFS